MSALARRRYRCFISLGACCAFARSTRATALFVLLDQIIVTIPLPEQRHQLDARAARAPALQPGPPA
jgi:hypothetical protein